jgi:hypothetical protein
MALLSHLEGSELMPSWLPLAPLASLAPMGEHREAPGPAMTRQNAWGKSNSACSVVSWHPKGEGGLGEGAEPAH